MSAARYDAFRAEVRHWLAENLTADLREVTERATSVFIDKPHNLAWQRILATRGWVAPHWPAEYGGPGWDETERYIFASECARAEAPSLAPMGLRMVAPCIMRYGTEEQKAHYLPRILAGEDYWCQGYSEPQAGSDLAALSLRADRDGDHYVLNGSKIWTTHAHFANRMFCLVRTSREGPRQAGITFLLLDMDTPGINVLPIVSIANDHDFNQVFFEDVRVPVSGRLGEENQGWTVAKYLLEFERAVAYAAGLHAARDKLEAAARETGLLMDLQFRRKLSLVAAQISAIEAVELGVMAAMASGRNPGPASSLLKIQGTETQQRIQELAIEVAGHYAAPDQHEARQPGSGLAALTDDSAMIAAPRYFNGRAASIYGGSNEIQRGIIARQVLGL
ncbi:MAG: acyl-CoA dehydrogenase family protein [Sphingomonadales bacterium]|jgi:alkylation response protein AidB-like acyl-CoA dehydrogenase|nr:acyl-CoA dehydrogenase family protein [Sphingomonadales bacterium]MBK6718552.1 acyl-CoA dehydrogenase family protein [Sphingomonadales bacterium]MBK8862309.1 acyl-CoA dehydrogenase family protein [Sphingomonadales bacterium]